MKTRDQIIEKLQAEIDVLEKRIAKARELPEAFDSLEMPAYFFNNGELIDFDNLTHDQVISVVKAIGGKWDKELADSESVRIHYKTVLPNGQKVRCYSGEPPPNCKIVDVVEVIPAVPEQIVTRKKLQCT